MRGEDDKKRKCDEDDFVHFSEKVCPDFVVSVLKDFIGLNVRTGYFSFKQSSSFLLGAFFHCFD